MHVWDSADQKQKTQPKMHNLYFNKQNFKRHKQYENLPNSSHLFNKINANTVLHRSQDSIVIIVAMGWTNESWFNS